MARTYTEGYRKGFEVTGRDLSRKKTVSIRYELGFERMIRAAIRQFREMGLEPILYRAASWSVTKSPNRKIGYHSGSANRQYDYDHRYDQAIYFDKAFKDRKLAVLKTAYESCKKEAAWYAGPAVVETFGEDGFQPVSYTHLQEAWKNIPAADSPDAQRQSIRQYQNRKRQFPVLPAASGPDLSEENVLHLLLKDREDRKDGCRHFCSMPKPAHQSAFSAPWSVSVYL